MCFSLENDVYVTTEAKYNNKLKIYVLYNILYKQFLAHWNILTVLTHKIIV